MNIDAVEEIIKQYGAHGWTFRRAVLSEADVRAFGDDLLRNYPEADILKGPESGLWFSRRTLTDREAWELRRLSGSPFALIAVVEDSLSGTEHDAVLNEVEQRMFSGQHPEPTSH